MELLLIVVVLLLSVRWWRLGILALAQIALSVCMNTFEGKHGKAGPRPGILIRE